MRRATIYFHGLLNLDKKPYFSVFRAVGLRCIFVLLQFLQFNSNRNFDLTSKKYTRTCYSNRYQIVATPPFTLLIYPAIVSHTRTVVRECFKGDEAKSMEKAKIRPFATPKPLNRSSQKLAGVITSGTAPDMQNFVATSSGVSVPQIRDFSVLLGVTSMFVFWVLQ